VIGVVGFVLATVFSGGLPLVVALAIIVFSNVLMFCLDFYCFSLAVKDMQSAPKDRILMMICSALSIIFTALGAFIAAGPLARLIVILLGVLFAGMQVGVLGWSWYQGERESNPCPQV
jgi:hypothetical protein